MMADLPAPLAAARFYGLSEEVAEAIQDADPTAGATALAAARKYGLSESAVLGVEAMSPAPPVEPPAEPPAGT